MLIVVITKGNFIMCLKNRSLYACVFVCCQLCNQVLMKLFLIRSICEVINTEVFESFVVFSFFSDDTCTFSSLRFGENLATHYHINCEGNYPLLSLVGIKQIYRCRLEYNAKVSRRGKIP